MRLLHFHFYDNKDDSILGNSKGNFPCLKIYHFDHFTPSYVSFITCSVSLEKNDHPSVLLFSSILLSQQKKTSVGLGNINYTKERERLIVLK